MSRFLYAIIAASVTLAEMQPLLNNFKDTFETLARALGGH